MQLGTIKRIKTKMSVKNVKILKYKKEISRGSEGAFEEGGFGASV